MAIFNCYVSSPKGKLVVTSWMNSYPLGSRRRRPQSAQSAQLLPSQQKALALPGEHGQEQQRLLEIM